MRRMMIVVMVSLIVLTALMLQDLKAIECFLGSNAVLFHL